VLYEMLSGAPAFPAKSFIESGHAILESEPPPLPESVPPSVDLLVRRCLEKDPARRFQSAADLAFDLGAATGPTSGKARPIVPRTSPSWVARLAQVGAVLAFGVVVALTTRWISTRLDAPELPTFERITFRDAAIGGARFTPEGRVVFSASFEHRPEEVYGYAPGSPGIHPLGLRPARLAAVSPKTGELGVLMGSTTRAISWIHGTLARVPAVGGAPRELAQDVAWADWTGSGELAAARRGPGGRMWIERPLGTKVWEGAGSISFLRRSPDGELLAFLHYRIATAQSEIIVLDRSNKPHVVLTSRPEAPQFFSLAWTPDGKRLRFAAVDPSGSKLSSVSLQGDVRPLYRFPEIRLLQDIAPDGTMIFSTPGWSRQIAVMRPGQASQGELGWLGSQSLRDLSLDGRMLLSVDMEGYEFEPKVVLEATDGTPPKVLGLGLPIALSPDGRTVAMASIDHRRLFLVPTGPGTTEEVPLSRLVVGRGQWSRDGRRLWVAARQNDDARFQLFPVDVANRKLLDPIADGDILDTNTTIAISPDDRWIAAMGSDRVLTVHPVNKGEPIRLSSLQAALSPSPAGWTSTGELWVGLRGATPPRLVRVEVPTGKITRSIDVDLRQLGGDEMTGARITPDESLLAVEYTVFRGWLDLMKGIPADR
jgi:Tol biopolymer transport system component